jgi:hypothetical protein
MQERLPLCKKCQPTPGLHLINGEAGQMYLPYLHISLFVGPWILPHQAVHADFDLHTRKTFELAPFRLDGITVRYLCQQSTSSLHQHKHRCCYASCQVLATDPKTHLDL